MHYRFGRGRQIGGPIVFIIGGILLIWGGFNYLKAKGSTDWPKTYGTIVSSSLKVRQVRNRGVRGSRMTANIEYQYRAEGENHTGTRVTYGSGWPFKNFFQSTQAKQAVSKYKKGHRVPVYYDPANPSRAVLVPGVTLETYLLPGLAVLTLIVGIGSYFGLSPRR